MSEQPQNLTNRTIMALCLLLFLVSIIVAILSFLIFDVFWFLIIPVAFLIVIILSQSFSRLFWNTNKKCPRCRVSTSIYSEFCPNCGFRLIISLMPRGHYRMRKTEASQAQSGGEAQKLCAET